MASMETTDSVKDNNYANYITPCNRVIHFMFISLHRIVSYMGILDDDDEMGFFSTPAQKRQVVLDLESKGCKLSVNIRSD